VVCGHTCRICDSAEPSYKGLNQPFGVGFFHTTEQLKTVKKLPAFYGQQISSFVFTGTRIILLSPWKYRETRTWHSTDRFIAHGRHVVDSARRCMESNISRSLWISRSEGRVFIASQIEHLLVAVEVSVVMTSRHLLQY